MSDRVKGFYVALDEDVRDDDFKRIKDAVLMLKGVLSVKKVLSDVDDWMNRTVIKTELIRKVYSVLSEDKE